MITEDALEVNRKHGTKRMERIYANFICFSNHKDAIKISTKDRRFWVHLMELPPRDAAYYNKLWTWLDSEGPSLLLHWLLERDISKFNFGQCPRVGGDEAKRQMELESRTELEEKLDYMIEDTEGPLKYKVTCSRFIEDWLVHSAELEVDRNTKAEIRAWLKKRISLGRVRGGVPSQYRDLSWFLILSDEQASKIKSTKARNEVHMKGKAYLRKNISAMMATIYGSKPTVVDLDEGDDK